MESQLFYGSVCLTDLIERAKQKHSGFTKGKNGKIYASVGVWLNPEPDKFGNVMSISVSPSKEMKDAEERFYIGNCKRSEGPKPVSDRDVNNIDDNFDIPSAPAANSDIPQSEESGDLPF